MCCKPVSDFDKSNKSSAHIRHPKTSFEVYSTGSQFGVSKLFWRSERNMLNKVGLRMHPCLTPWFTIKVSVILFPIFTHALSSVYGENVIEFSVYIMV